MEGIGLPHFVGVCFGKGETCFFGRAFDHAVDLLEQLELIDEASKGIGRNLFTPEMSALDAGSIYGLNVSGVVAESGEDFFNGLKEFFGMDFAGLERGLEMGERVWRFTAIAIRLGRFVEHSEGDFLRTRRGVLLIRRRSLSPTKRGA